MFNLLDSHNVNNTTEESPYLFCLMEGYVLNANGEITNNFPLNFVDLTSLNSLDRRNTIESISGGESLNTTIPECSLGGNSFLFRKCLSNVNIIRDSDLAILEICLSVEPNGTFLMLCPCFLNSLSTSFGKFSSERNFNSFLE